ncbi:hypothetical protein Tco_0785580 [Tanacetum coccineum]
MFEEDVIGFLKYVLGFKGVAVYIETNVSLIERHIIERMTSKDKGVLIEENMDHDVNDGVGKEFDGDNGNSDVDQGINVEWQDDPYHNVDEHEEPKEIMDMFADLDQVTEDQDVTYLFAIYEQPIDDVVPFKVVAEETIHGDDGEQVGFDKDVFQMKLYDAMVAPKMLEDDDGDVIPTKVYDALVAQEMLEDDDGDAIPTKIYDAMVAHEMLEDQTRAIERRSVMADKEDKDDAQ